MTSTCDFCEKWIASSWEQHERRLDNMRKRPLVEPYACPRCGGTYWAAKPPIPASRRPGKSNQIMLLVGAILAAIVVLVLMAFEVSAEETFRDPSGRIVGTATRDTTGTTTYRNGSGQMTGTSSTNSNGTTTFRNSSGQMTGTAERKR